MRLPCSHVSAHYKVPHNHALQRTNLRGFSLRAPYIVSISLIGVGIWLAAELKCYTANQYVRGRRVDELPDAGDSSAETGARAKPP